MPLFFLLLAGLSLPMTILLARNGEVIPLLPVAGAGIGVALVVYAIMQLLRRHSVGLAGTVGIVLALSALWVRFLLGFLYDFSGRGFSSEFFAHISFVSAEIAVKEYPVEGLVLLVIFLLMAYLLQRQIGKPQQTPFLHSLGALLLGAALVYLGAVGSPEVQLARAYDRYTSVDAQTQVLQSRTETRAQARQMLEPIRGQLALPVEKSALEASPPKKPLNLILIYLESFNAMVTKNDVYPGLTPEIAGLRERYDALNNIYSSAFVTIEGVANSQCGTLVNMEYVNNSLTTRKGRLPEMPCLADILHSAGYEQSYFGGAQLDFAGKGDFLREHGYDEIFGRGYWRDKGYPSFGNWGLADTHLLDQALARIKAYQQASTPFNLTLLTLGTHLPGYHYDECPRFTEDKDKAYLNAIHCTDFLLGKFVKQLEAQGVLEDSLLVVQADHGMFHTPEMKSLFGQRVHDTRLFTLLAMPESVKQRIGAFDHNRVGSSVDTVATLLDLMNIRHNSEFIFARSYFEEPPQPRYYLTRYHDHHQGKFIQNRRDVCDEEAVSTEQAVSLPLRACEKDRVMRSLNALNLTYSDSGEVDNQVCELGVQLNRDDKTRRLQILWGNQNLSDQFYWRGLKKRKNQVDGVYAVLLDQDGQVIQTQFYSADRRQEIGWLRDLIRNPLEGKTVLLVNNVDVSQLSPGVKAVWPPVLLTQEIVYGSLSKQTISPVYAQAVMSENNRFLPVGCPSGA